MKTLTKLFFIFITFMIAGFRQSHAASMKTTAGLNLLEASSARASSLGEAFSAIQNDASGMAYNPASLRTLQSHQVSFLYEKGMADDAFGQFIWGSPSGLGLSVASYQGGETHLSDGVTDRTAVAQRDLSASLGYAKKMGSLLMGLSGKYFSSELAETAKATTFAMDLGMQMPLTKNLRFGAAIQNFGGKIQYDQAKEDLPTVARAGVSLPLFKSTLILFDGIYNLHQQNLSPAIGVETLVGPIALRAGYKGGSDLQNFSLGTGFFVRQFSLDYSFGMVNTLNSTHKVSVTMKFGGKESVQDLSLAPATHNQPAELVFVQKQHSGEIRPTQLKSLGGVIYEVAPHDTLAKIARAHYGDTREWKRIYEANRHILGDMASTLEVGQKIRLP